jgi:DHA1 family inner membrane transport protein
MVPRPNFLQSNATIALTIAIGCCGTLVLGIQPLLLETLLSQGILNTTEVGWTATAEVLGMAIGVLLGSRLLSKAHAKAGLIACGIGMASSNIATIAVHAVAGVILVRIISGVTEGVMVAAAVLSISYSNMPGRLNAIFLAAGTTPQILLAYGVPAVIVPRFGPNSGFGVMAVTGLVSVALAIWVRAAFAPHPESVNTNVSWTPRIILVLFATLTTAAAIGACWGYIGSLASENGFSEQTTGVAVTASLIFQVLGSVFVMVIGYRLSFRIALVGGAIIQTIAIIVLLHSNSIRQFTVALSVFGFCWQGCMPFAMDLIVEEDESRATAPLILPLMLTGLSVGPFIASFCVGRSVAAALWVAIGGFVCALMAYMLVFRRQRPRHQDSRVI